MVFSRVTKERAKKVECLSRQVSGNQSGRCRRIALRRREHGGLSEIFDKASRDKEVATKKEYLGISSQEKLATNWVVRVSRLND